MKRLLGLAICLFGLGLAAQANAAEFYLSPSSDQFTTGCESTVSIMMDTEGETSDAANIYVYYDPADIEIVDKDSFTAGDQIQTGNAYSIYVDNIADTGEIRLTGFTVMGGFSGVRTFGSIVFKGREGVTETSMSIYYVPGSTTDSNIAQKDTGLDILDGVSGGAYTFTTGFCNPDVTAPWVTDASPYNGEENYPLDGNVSFTLNDNQAGVDLDTVSITVNGINYSLAGPNTFSYSGQPLEYDMVVNPIADFPDGLEIDVSVYGCDFDSNCRTTNWSFNEPPPPPPLDTTPPWVTNRDPGPNEQNYPLDGNVTFDLQDNQDGVDLESVIITVDGIEYTFDGPYNFSSVGIPLDYAMTVDPIVDFPDEQAVTINVYACDVSNNCGNTNWVFNIPPPPPPTCDELYSTCEGWYETYECEFEGYECPPGGCPTCDTCETCEPEIIYETEECPGETIEVPIEIVSDPITVEVKGETIYVPEVTVEQEYMLSRSQVSIYALRRRLPLPVDPFGKFYMLPGFDYVVDLDGDSLPKEVSSVQWFVNDHRYAMSYSNGIFSTSLEAPEEPAAYPAHVIVAYTDGTIDRLDYTLINVPLGVVTGEDEEKNVGPLEGAQVSLIDQETGELWDSAMYLQLNPTFTDENGQYGFLVPEGNYEAVFSKDGYRDTSDVFYTMEIVNSSRELIRIPGPITGIGGVFDWWDYLMAMLRESGVQLAVTLLMLLILLGTLLDAYLLRSEIRRGVWWLYLLLRHPHALLHDHHQCGIVYNSLTKQPLSYARISLYEMDKQMWINTAIANESGKYKMYAEAGRYVMKIDRPGFVAPSPYLIEIKHDEVFRDLYLGREIQVPDKVQIVEPNVPMDSILPAGSAARIALHYHVRRWEHAWVIGAPMASLLGVIIAPFAFNLAVFAVTLALFAAIHNAKKDMGKQKAKGRVIDEITGRGVGDAVIKMYDERAQMPLFVAVTDHHGYYKMPAGPGQLYLTIERAGFVKTTVKKPVFEPGKHGLETKTEIKIKRA